MMRRPEKKRRFHIHLYARDIERLRDWVGDRMPVSEAAREIIRSFLNQVEGRVMAGASHPKLTPDEVNAITNEVKAHEPDQ